MLFGLAYSLDITLWMYSSTCSDSNLIENFIRVITPSIIWASTSERDSFSWLFSMDMLDSFSSSRTASTASWPSLSSASREPSS
jgi:hypothetical protein